MKLPMIGTVDKTASSEFQVTLVDSRDKTLHPMDYPRINRFFDNLDDRNSFITMLESSIIKAGGKIVHNERFSHPLFSSFYIFDSRGNKSFDLTVYQ